MVGWVTTKMKTASVELGWIVTYMSECSKRSIYSSPPTDSETEDSSYLETTCESREKDRGEGPYDKKLDWTEFRSRGPVHDDE